MIEFFISWQNRSYEVHRMHCQYNIHALEQQKRQTKKQRKYLVGSGSEVVEAEAKVLVDLLRRRRQAELVHNAEGSVRVAAPGVDACVREGENERRGEMERK